MDYRDEAAMNGKWYERFDEKSMIAYLTLDGETETEIPCKYEVCPTCDGRGSYVNPSIDSHGISAEEWKNDWDEESREDYMSGGYDIQCATCGGDRVSPTPDYDNINDEVRAEIRNYFKSEAEFRAIQRAERAMGA